MCNGFVPAHIQLAEHHHEFVAAETRDSIHLAHTTGETARYLYQQQIAHTMPIRIIERLEVIQIEKHYRAIMAAAFAGSHRLPEPVIEQAAVGQLRQGIVKSQISNLFFGLFALGDVLHDSDEIPDRSIPAGNRGDDERLVIEGTILAPVY